VNKNKRRKGEPSLRGWGFNPEKKDSNKTDDRIGKLLFKKKIMRKGQGGSGNGMTLEHELHRRINDRGDYAKSHQKGGHTMRSPIIETRGGGWRRGKIFEDALRQTHAQGREERRRDTKGSQWGPWGGGKQEN